LWLEKDGRHFLIEKWKKAGKFSSSRYFGANPVSYSVKSGSVSTLWVNPIELYSPNSYQFFAFKKFVNGKRWSPFFYLLFPVNKPVKWDENHRIRLFIIQITHYNDNLSIWLRHFFNILIFLSGKKTVAISWACLDAKINS
jgi:hypothetical protein